MMIRRLALATTVTLALAACSAKDDEAARDTAPAAVTTGTATAADGTMGAATDTAAQGALVDPNTATRDQLLGVPGMTAAIADTLVAGRPYADMVAVDRVLARQIADTTARENVYRRLWKPIDLNKATRAEILLVPGVGNRMAHEFEEYRPWKTVEQFRREIGKYVNDTEVTRLEQYVRIP